jgi:hypothetical protein
MEPLVPTVADVAVTCPELHLPGTTVAEVRELFLDDHVHVALLVDGGRLLAVVEPGDLRPELYPGLPAWLVGRLAGRVVGPATPATHALALMRRNGRRRLAVVDREGRLQGLLCLKASGRGFCSDADVASRKQEHALARASA